MHLTRITQQSISDQGQPTHRPTNPQQPTHPQPPHRLTDHHGQISLLLVTTNNLQGLTHTLKAIRGKTRQLSRYILFTMQQTANVTCGFFDSIMLEIVVTSQNCQPSDRLSLHYQLFHIQGALA